MAIEVANVRSNGVMVSEEEETTKVVVPTKIEEAGRKYCCATCFNSYGRVTHVALEKRVTLKLNSILSGQKGPKGQRYYCNPYGINLNQVEAGLLDHPARIRKFDTLCNFCGETVGWHYTARRDELRSQLYWSATYMDREKVVLLDEEEENEIASGYKDDSEMARMTYLMAGNKVEA
ncbi:uncharacterized protein LOC113329474 isoform X1 [Papaver somniferum]|uniref:uncharacterized protein LOC113329474 isoform X1 n=1 Tax=Papaver somniferum TaxID=3469 RepID=UPI000E6F8E6C|nr:uncharacterized protein LOC113329474 isoform X1 [Papaver somniferum]